MSHWSYREENRLFRIVESCRIGRRVDWDKAYKLLKTQRTQCACHSRYLAIRKARKAGKKNTYSAKRQDPRINWSIPLQQKLIRLAAILEKRWNRLRWKWMLRELDQGDLTASMLERQLNWMRSYNGWTVSWAWNDVRFLQGPHWLGLTERFTTSSAGPIKQEDLTDDETYDPNAPSDSEDESEYSYAVKDEEETWEVEEEEEEEDTKPNLSAIRYKRAPSADDFLRREAALRAAKREKLAEKEKGKGKEKERTPSPSRSPSPLPAPSTLLNWIRRPGLSTSNAHAGPSGSSSSSSLSTAAPSTSTSNPSSSSDPAPVPSSDALPSSDTTPTSPAPSPPAGSRLDKGKDRAVSPSSLEQADSSLTAPLPSSEPIPAPTSPVATATASKEPTRAVSPLPSTSSSSSSSAALTPAVESTPPSRRILTVRASQQWEKELEKAAGEANEATREPVAVGGSSVSAAESDETGATALASSLPALAKDAGISTPAATDHSSSSCAAVEKPVAPKDDMPSAETLEKMLAEAIEREEARVAAEAAYMTSSSSPATTTTATAHPAPRPANGCLVAAVEAEMAGGPVVTLADMDRLLREEEARTKKAEAAGSSLPTVKAPVQRNQSTKANGKTAPSSTSSSCPLSASSSSNSITFSRPLPPSHPLKPATLPPPLPRPAPPLPSLPSPNLAPS